MRPTAWAASPQAPTGDRERRRRRFPGPVPLGTRLRIHRPRRPPRSSAPPRRWPRRTENEANAHTPPASRAVKWPQRRAERGLRDRQAPATPCCSSSGRRRPPTPPRRQIISPGLGDCPCGRGWVSATAARRSPQQPRRRSSPTGLRARPAAAPDPLPSGPGSSPFATPGAGRTQPGGSQPAGLVWRALPGLGGVRTKSLPQKAPWPTRPVSACKLAGEVFYLVLWHHKF